MKDYYKILNVDRSASEEEIKKAYRRLASQHHPDKGGDKERFQEIQEAYAVLGDKEKRSEFDNPRTQFNFGSNGFDFGDLFSMFGQGGFNHPRRNHARMSLWISLYDAATGGRRTISLGTQQGTNAVEIEIPQGIDDGDNVQYAGLGPNGADLVIQFRIKPDNKWQRQGLNLITEKKISVWDLIVGGDLTVQDIFNVELVTKIPPGTQPGTMLRLKGRGLRNRQGSQGDAYVRVVPYLPTRIDPAIIDAIKKHRE